MGITGLIPFLEKASARCHLRELRGQCVAIDSYCWLHKGAFACADKLARGEPTDVHIQYCLKYVNMLLSYDIKPVLVFDGRHLPAKAMTEAKRRESRDNSKKRAAELLRMGKVEEAKSFLRRCVDITHEMALQLIQECRRRNVDCVVAPYEADAQLAFLNKKGIAQAVITEDSDLMLFGCSKVLFKLDLTGSGLMIEREKLYLAMGCKEEKYTFDKFRWMCIMSGCDYLDSLPGIGLAKAKKFVLTTEEPDIRRALSKIPAYLNMRQLTVTEEYKTDFQRADATFKHMVVYDPTERKQTRLYDPEEMGTDPELCCNAGVFLDEDIALQLALGNVDPFRMTHLDNWHPDDPECQPTGGKTSDWKQASIAKHSSVWRGTYEPQRSRIIRQEPTIPSSFKLKELVKRPVPNAEFEEQKESIDDVLEAYGIKQKDEQKQPPLKRLCLTQSAERKRKTIDFDEVQVLQDMEELQSSPSKSPVRRNPFQVTSTGPSSSIRRSASALPNTLMSPTKITPERSSLLRNVSPVKRIEYDIKPSTATTSSKNDKLSRFKRTMLASDGQKVISRFFSGGAAATATTNNSPPVAPASPEGTPPKATASVYLLSPEAKLPHHGECTPKKQQQQPPTAATNNELCSPAPPTKVEPKLEQIDSGFVEEPEDGFAPLSSSQKENDDQKQTKTSRLQLFARKDVARFGAESSQNASGTDDAGLSEIKDEIVEIDDDEVEEVEVEVQARTAGAPKSGSSGIVSSQKKTGSCRRVGLSKVKGSKDAGPTQSKLSMFGFQKKTQLK